MRQKGCEQTAKDKARALQQKRFHAVDNKARAFARADYVRRKRAAGLDRAPHDDMDAFRSRMARLLHMCINDWEGCPLRLCQRMRGCMAPQSRCANHADDPPATEEETAVAIRQVRRALDKTIGDSEGRDAWYALVDAEKAEGRQNP